MAKSGVILSSVILQLEKLNDDWLWIAFKGKLCTVVISSNLGL